MLTPLISLETVRACLVFHRLLRILWKTLFLTTLFSVVKDHNQRAVLTLTQSWSCCSKLWAECKKPSPSKSACVYTLSADGFHRTVCLGFPSGASKQNRIKQWGAASFLLTKYFLTSKCFFQTSELKRLSELSQVTSCHQLMADGQLLSVVSTESCFFFFFFHPCIWIQFHIFVWVIMCLLSCGIINKWTQPNC